MSWRSSSWRSWWRKKDKKKSVNPIGDHARDIKSALRILSLSENCVGVTFESWCPALDSSKDGVQLCQSEVTKSDNQNLVSGCWIFRRWCLAVAIKSDQKWKEGLKHLGAAPDNITATLSAIHQIKMVPSVTKLNWSKVTKSKKMVSSLPSLCRLQAILTLLLTIIACQVTKISWINPLDFCNYSWGQTIGDQNFLNQSFGFFAFFGGQIITCQVTKIFLNKSFGFFCNSFFGQSIACQVNKILHNQSFGFFCQKRFLGNSFTCQISDNLLAFFAILWPFICQFYGHLFVNSKLLYPKSKNQSCFQKSENLFKIW